MSAALARGNVALALSVFKAMHRSAPGGNSSSSRSAPGTSADLGSPAWPSASLSTISLVVSAHGVHCPPCGFSRVCET